MDLETVRQHLISLKVKQSEVEPLIKEYVQNKDNPLDERWQLWGNQV